MTLRSLPIVVIASLIVSSAVAQEPMYYGGRNPMRHQKKKAMKVDQAASSDTSHAPLSYKKRIEAFRAMITKEPTQALKTRKAIELAKNRKSPFRIDAINFLADTRAKDAAPALIELTRDAEVKEFAIYALGEVRVKESVPVLIGALSDENENVRGNAERSLLKVTRRNFSYHYSATPQERARGIEEVRQWWKESKAQFVVREATPEEQKEAQDAWDRYGKNYVQDLNR